MELSAIIFRLFAWARPLLWYSHKLDYFLRIAIRYVADEACLARLIDYPDLRAWVEGMLVDAERCCDIVIALRTRELLGLPMPEGKPGIGGSHRIHVPPSLERLVGRLDRLVARYTDSERLARLRAGRLRREQEAAPVLLAAGGRPAHALLRRAVRPPSKFFFFFAAVFSGPDSPGLASPAGLRIRAPP